MNLRRDNDSRDAAAGFLRVGFIVVAFSNFSLGISYSYKASIHVSRSACGVL